MVAEGHPDQPTCEGFSIAKRSLTVLGVAFLLLVALASTIHIMTEIERNRTEDAALWEQIEGICERQLEIVEQLKKKRVEIQEHKNYVDILFLEIDELTKQVKELRRDFTNLDKQDRADASLLFEKSKKLREDVMIVNQSTHDLAAWLKIVDADYDPGYLAQAMKDIERLNNQVYWLRKGKK